VLEDLVLEEDLLDITSRGLPTKLAPRGARCRAAADDVGGPRRGSNR